MSQQIFSQSILGNQYLNEAIMESMNELNLAWIGATPGVKVRIT